MGGKENGIAFCELRQDWFDFLLIFKNQITRIYVIKNIQQEKIKSHFAFGCT